ncbi:hypothetical protein PMAYCL1PPCAC_26134, partial [Pristionchus mayeri]
SSLPRYLLSIHRLLTPHNGKMLLHQARTHWLAFPITSASRCSRTERPTWRRASLFDHPSKKRISSTRQ